MTGLTPTLAARKSLVTLLSLPLEGNDYQHMSRNGKSTWNLHPSSPF